IVAISSTQLIVLGLATTNAYQAPTSDFNPGDSLYATFRIAYSSSGFLGQGTFNIQVRDPSGGFVANLTSIYDPNRGLYYTPSGFQITSGDPAGAWDLVFPANSLSDPYGNSGPSIPETYRFRVHQPVSPVSTISPFYYAIIALAIGGDRKSTRLNSSHGSISYAVFCLKKKKREDRQETTHELHAVESESRS